MNFSALALPLLLLPVMTGVFGLAARHLGAEAGYLPGFGFYWTFWCLLVPRWLLGKKEFHAILRDRAPLFSLPPATCPRQGVAFGALRSPDGRGEPSGKSMRLGQQKLPAVFRSLSQRERVRVRGESTETCLTRQQVRVKVGRYVFSDDLGGAPWTGHAPVDFLRR